MPKRLRRTKIIVTLGPATDHKNNLEKIIISGANIVRLNFSHGKTTEHFYRAQKVRKIASQLNKYIAILGDLQGPKIRISTIQSNAINLKSGDNFIIDSSEDHINYHYKYVKVNYKALPQDVSPGDFLLLDDGKIQLQVFKIQKTQIHTKVIIGGTLFNNKGINKLGGGLLAKVLTDKDKLDIIAAAKIGVDYLAISFPKSSSDLNYARKLLINAGSNAKIISKIERAEVVKSNETIDDIIQASDAVMIARGDLGVEIGEPELIKVQKQIIQRAHNLNKAVITATQMMESMIMNSIPTRAEVMDVANAVLDGTDAVMLSAETATGQYPIETVTAMANVCLGAEKISNTGYSKIFDEQQKKIRTVTEAISISTMHVANHLKTIKAVISITDLDQSVLLMSRVNSTKPIFALSNNLHTLNIVTLYRGVIPMYFNNTGNPIENARYASNILRDQGLLIPGELVIVIQDNIQNEHYINNTSHILQVR